MLEFWSKQLLLSAKSDPYKPETVLFESATPGTYSLNLAGDGVYELYCIAGGGGGSSRNSGGSVYINSGGGSGSGFIGTMQLSKGIYSITIGAGGNGGDTYGGGGGNSAIGNTIVSYGGGGGNATGLSGSGGSGGAIPSVNVAAISIALHTGGNNGGSGRGSTAAGGGSSVYGGWGAGGMANKSNRAAGTAGYVKVIYKRLKP